MNVLAIDTSSPLLSVALQSKHTGILEETLEGFYTHAENLLPTIGNLLEKASLSLEQIDAYLIGRGPGSFTGLRIGFATFKGFLASQKKDCYGALALDMIAENVEPGSFERLGVCLDAFRERIYTRFYESRSGMWMASSEPKVLTFEIVRQYLSRGTGIAGNALSKYATAFASMVPETGLLPQSTWFPRASTLIHWFNKRDNRLTQLKEPADFIPLYFRLSEAEERKRDHVNHH